MVCSIPLSSLTTTPADLLPFEQIQRYRSYGMSEEDFIHSIVSPFRVSFYVSHRDALPGRPDITNLQLFDTQTTFLIDRRGDIASLLFSSAENLAKASLSLSFLAPFTSQQNSRHTLNMIIHPSILASFSRLSSKPTYKDLLSHSQRIHGESYSSDTLKKGLINTLEYFINLNYLTLWIESDQAHDKGARKESNRGAVPEKVTSSSLQDRLRPHQHSKIESPDSSPASPSTSTTSQVHESGLTFRKRSKTEEDERKTPPQPLRGDTAGAVDEQDNSIPPICRIPGMSAGPFCEIYQQKKMKSSSAAVPPSLPPPTSSETLRRSQDVVKQEASESSPVDEIGEATRIENLKKMGFTDVIIQKILAKNKEKKTTSAEISEGTSGRPAICSLPGVQADSLCKAYENKGKRKDLPPTHSG